jgi:hypothetical protein
MAKELTRQEEEALLNDDDDMQVEGEQQRKTLVSVGSNTDADRPNLCNAGTSTDPDVRERERGLSTSSTSRSGTGGTGFFPRAYYNVRAARSAADTVRPLCGSEVSFKNDLGSFDDPDDNRVQLANHRHCFSSKTNISTSFELDTMICNTCTHKGKHKVLRRETERPDTVDDSPICFVLSDQCFPPVLSPEGDGDCIKILRIEGGGLMELTNAFISATKGS